MSSADIEPASSRSHADTSPFANLVQSLVIPEDDTALTRRDGQFVGRICTRADLADLHAPWRDLAARALEDNVYFAPRYAEALLESVERARDIRFASVWDGARLMALLPFTTRALRVPVLEPGATAWEGDYTFNSQPLLDKTDSARAADALLDVLAGACKGDWRVPRVNVAGPTCRALLQAMQRRAQPAIVCETFQRAILDRGLSYEQHLQQRLSSNRRKSLARNRKRLEGVGAVTHSYATSGASLDAAVEAFLRLEASGWKGERGTALACAPDTTRFALKAFTGDEGVSICRADVLKLDDAPVAVSMIVMSGRTGFAVKGCYDETYRSYSPGLLLEAEIVRSFLNGDWADRLDGATSGTHALDGLWSDNIEVGDLLLSFASVGANARLRGLETAIRWRAKAKAEIKRILARK